MRLAGKVEGTRFGVAVSGGPDSMALLNLMRLAFPDQVEAATVDHGLRAEAAEEAAMVGRWCAAQGIAHATLSPDRPITGNIQSSARSARYALLDDWRQRRSIAWVLTAHHADDQAETMLMRLNRGSGVSGLAGIRSKAGHVLRPLLGWRRAALLEHCQDAALPFVDDPSNHNPDFDRVAMRNQLQKAGWIDPVALARSAAALQDAEEAIGYVVAQLLETHVVAAEEGWRMSAMTELPREFQRRIILHLLSQDAQMGAPRGDSLDHAIACAHAGGQASLGRWLLQGGEQWWLRLAPLRRSPLGK